MDVGGTGGAVPRPTSARRSVMKRSSSVPAVLLTLVALATGGCGYNKIQTMDERVNQAKGQIETQLQRRADLVPNLVETVKGVAKQESTVFISIAEARARLSGAVQSGDVSEMAAANQAAQPGPGPAPRHRGELSRAAFQRELPGAAGPARGYRESDLGRAAGLQYGGGRVQRLHPALPLQPDREGLRDGARGSTSRPRRGRRKRRK